MESVPACIFALVTIYTLFMDFSESAEVETERKFDSREKCFDKFDKSGDGVNGTARGGARVYARARDGRCDRQAGLGLGIRGAVVVKLPVAARRLARSANAILNGGDRRVLVVTGQCSLVATDPLSP